MRIEVMSLIVLSLLRGDYSRLRFIAMGFDPTPNRSITSVKNHCLNRCCKARKKTISTAALWKQTLITAGTNVASGEYKYKYNISIRESVVDEWNNIRPAWEETKFVIQDEGLKYTPEFNILAARK